MKKYKTRGLFALTLMTCFISGTSAFASSTGQKCQWNGKSSPDENTLNIIAMNICSSHMYNNEIKSDGDSAFVHNWKTQKLSNGEYHLTGSCGQKVKEDFSLAKEFFEIELQYNPQIFLTDETINGKIGHSTVTVNYSRNVSMDIEKKICSYSLDFDSIVIQKPVFSFISQTISKNALSLINEFTWPDMNMKNPQLTFSSLWSPVSFFGDRSLALHTVVQDDQSSSLYDVNTHSTCFAQSDRCIPEKHVVYVVSNSFLQTPKIQINKSDFAYFAGNVFDFNSKNSTVQGCSMFRFSDKTNTGTITAEACRRLLN
jgi:hypothetical protein